MSEHSLCLKHGDLRELFTKDRKVRKYSFEGQCICMYLLLKIWNKQRASCVKSQQQIKPARADTDTGKALLTSSATPQLGSIEHVPQKHLFLPNPKGPQSYTWDNIKIKLY